jgi:phage baseplate assembly protein W
MGKTFKISDIGKTGIGDVELSNVGQPQIIQGRDKLSQDILEILFVITGERDVPRTMADFGSKLMIIMGYPLPAGSIETLLRSAIDDALRKLQKLQLDNLTSTTDETIARISVVQIEKTESKIGYNFYVGIETQDGQTLTLQGVLV